jgi:uncharacterized circularly permuted ATP-grasp superfamily protein
MNSGVTAHVNSDSWINSPGIIQVNSTEWVNSLYTYGNGVGNEKQQLFALAKRLYDLNF